MSTISDELNDRRVRLQQVGLAVLAASLLVAAALIYWAAVAQRSILARGDNPRLVEAELAIERGRIFDADGIVLAESRPTAEGLQRLYPIAGTGAAIGYYSFRHGTAGVEEAYDSVLRGETGDQWSDYWRYAFLHEPRQGRDVRVTIDAGLQLAAGELLSDYHGAVVLLDVADGSLRAIASHPAYDPNMLEANFESLAADQDGPLLNRATQGQYQPGMALQPFVLATALDTGVMTLEDEAASDGAFLTVNGERLTCSDPAPTRPLWAEVLRSGCPAPMAEVGRTLGPASLAESFGRWGFYTAPDVPLPIEVTTDRAIDDPGLAAAGQDLLTVTPLQMALAFGALANQGQPVRPQLVSAYQDPSGAWQVEAPPEEVGPAAVSAGAAAEVLSGLALRDNIAEHAALAIAGPEGNRNAWYLGLLRAGGRRQVVVVILEGTADLAAARQVGRTLLQLAG